MQPESWVLQLRQRKRRLKIFLFFNRTRKRTLLLRPGTVASVDRARSLFILQTPTKNVQELAKEEGKESEAKRSWGEKLRYQRGPSLPLQAAGETLEERLLRSTDIRFWIRVHFKAASAGGNQFRRSRLILFLSACAKCTGLVAAGARLRIHHHHQPSSFY